MSDQARLRRHIAALEDLQRRRIELAEKRRAATEKLIERRQLEIDNLKAGLTIGGGAVTWDLYDQVSITPEQLIAVLHECESKWPGATLHKNDVTKNLSIKADGQYVGMVDLMDATLAVWADPDD